jgi:hypothetical protein
MYKKLKPLHPGGDANPGSSVFEADAMTTMPRRQGMRIWDPYVLATAL